MNSLHRLSILFLGLGLTLGCSSSESTSGAGGASTTSVSSTASSSTGDTTSSSSSTGAGGAGGAGGATTGSGGAGGAGGAGVAIKDIALTIDPNALLWDDAEQTLYLADDAKNQLVKWTDQDGFAVVADLPPAGSMSGPGYGQMVRLADKSFVIPRFGFGTNGDVVVVHPNLMSDIVPNLDATRRRIGLGMDASGKLYIGGFVKVGMGQKGFVSVLDIVAGTETDIAIMGLQKVVGVVVDSTSLYVSDQTTLQVLKSDLATPDQATKFNKAGVGPVDLLSIGPNGSIFSGGTLGQIYQISSAGTLTVFYGGLRQVRGTAYDAKGKRLFAVDHNGTPMDGKPHRLYILPLE